MNPQQRSRSAKQHLTSLFSDLKTDQLYAAVTGRGDADNTVLVPDKPGYIYVRIPKRISPTTGEMEEYSEAIALSQEEHRHNVPVLLKRSEFNPRTYEVVEKWQIGYGSGGVDLMLRSVAPHHKSHDLYDPAGGHDPVMLDTLQLKNLQVRPTSPPSSRVVIGGGWYTWKDRTIHWFDEVEEEMASYVPSGTFIAAYDSLWLDPTDESIVHNVVETVDSPATFNVEDVVTWPTGNYIPLACVRMTPGEYQIAYSSGKNPNLIDLRSHQSLMPDDVLLDVEHNGYLISTGTYTLDFAKNFLVTPAGSGKVIVTGTFDIEEDDVHVLDAITLNFEGDPFIDLNVIDEGGRKATVTGTFDHTPLDSIYVNLSGDLMFGSLEIDVGSATALVVGDSDGVGDVLVVDTNTPEVTVTSRLVVTGGNHITLDNGASVQFKDSGGTTRTFFSMSATDQILIGPTGSPGGTTTNIRFRPGAAEAMTLTEGGLFAVGNASPSGTQVEFVQGSTSAAIPVLTLDQADVDEPFIKLVGDAAAATLTRDLVDVGDVSSFTPVGYAKIEVQDDGNQITDGDYYVEFGTLA